MWSLHAAIHTDTHAYKLKHTDLYFNLKFAVHYFVLHTIFWCGKSNHIVKYDFPHKNVSNSIKKTFSNCMFMLYCNYIINNENISKGSISTWLLTRSSRCFPLTTSTAASLCDEFVPSWSQPVNGLYDGYLWPWPQWVDESDPCVHLCFRDVKPNSGWDWSMSGRCEDKARGRR